MCTSHSGKVPDVSKLHALLDENDTNYTEVLSLYVIIFTLKETKDDERLSALNLLICLVAR